MPKLVNGHKIAAKADLRRANLRAANLYGANLYEANLREADLCEADLRRADLRGAYLRGADLPPFQIPQEGSLIVYKKLANRILAKLLIPESAKRTASLVGRKCRAEFVDVIELFGCSHSDQARDTYSGELLYAPLSRVYPDKYDPDIRLECTNGIHFFLTREEAEAY